MKAILVIDMPKNCTMCDIRWSCPVWNKWNGYSDRLDECSLKPMPTKKTPLFDPDHCDIEEEIKIVHEIVGYNRCIDEILGETE